MSEEESPALGAELGRWKPCPISSTDQQTGSPAARHGLYSNTHVWQLKRWSGHPLGEVLTASALIHGVLWASPRGTLMG